jgi:hypothetical protein
MSSSNNNWWDRIAPFSHDLCQQKYEELEERYILAIESDNAWRETAENLRAALRVAKEALERINSDQELEVSYKPAVNAGKSYFDFCDMAQEALAKIKEIEK